MSLLKKWLTKFLPIKVQNGYGISTDASVKLKKDPTERKPENLVFFQLRQDLGTFEIREVRHTLNGETTYIIYSVDTDTEFKCNKKWFDFFFEETQIEPLFKS